MLKEQKPRIPDMILELEAQGLSPEQIVVGMQKFLCGAHPSVKSLYRWKAETGRPSRTYSNALSLLWSETTNGGSHDQSD